MRLGANNLVDAALAAERAGWADTRLLGAFVDQQDGEAFRVIVGRHGAMVWGVCRRLLGNSHDAEDAFQATFLVLVRRAASVAPREMLGNWLYGVAHRTAVKARAAADRRRARERQVEPGPDPAARAPDPDTDDAGWRELRPLIDRELSRLPEKYRAPLILCDLTGFTRKEAAEQLGWPEGTVSGRLSRARALLADRLTRRGVALSGSALGVFVSQNAAAAGVPAALVRPLIEVAGLLAPGERAAVALAPGAETLAEGVLRDMALTKITTAVAAVLAVGLCVSGAAVALSPAGGGQNPVKNAVPAPIPNGQQVAPLPGAQKLAPKFFGFNLPGNHGNNQKGTNEKDGDNNQKGKDEPNGQNNQKGTNEKDGDNNQKGNGQNNQKGG